MDGVASKFYIIHYRCGAKRCNNVVIVKATTNMISFIREPLIVLDLQYMYLPLMICFNGDKFYQFGYR